MRIIAGTYRGRALAGLGKGDDRAHLRPTSDRVRESLFNILAQLGAPDGARVLDLFAGTGALGLEARSRGAAHVTFVESGRTALALISRNIRLLKCEARTDLIKQDATRLAQAPGPPHDLIFLDPPYGKGLGERAIAAGVAGNWIARDALVVWEENAPVEPPPDFERLDHRRYGDTHISILRRDVSD